MGEKERQVKQQNVNDVHISKLFLDNKEGLTDLKKRAKKRERNNINSVSSNNSSVINISGNNNKPSI